VIASLRPGITGTAGTPVDALPLASPWAPVSHLTTLVVSEAIAAITGAGGMTRAQAMRDPAVRRARNIVCGTIARIPLRAYRGDDTTPLDRAAEPSWINRTDAQLPPSQRMLWTADDLFFYGMSCWYRTENAQPTASGRIFPLKMDRIPMSNWRLEDDSGRVLLRQTEVRLIFGPDEGMLLNAADAITHRADLMRAADRAAKHPAPYLELHNTGDELTDDQIVALVDAWAKARENPNGGVGYTNRSIELRPVGTFDAHLVIEGRQAAVVDIARHANLPAELLDATGTNGTLTYQTSRDNDRRTIDYGVGSMMTSISGWLSQDDVCPRGQRNAFDLEEWLRGTVPGQPAPQTPAPAPTAAVTPTTSPPTAAPVPASTETGETPQ
jgi:hypothetical protein